jgi:hypothetical protein
MPLDGAEENAMFKRLGLWIALGTTLLLAAAAAGQQAKWAARNDETAKSLIHMERQWAEADCDRNLSAQTTLADDFEGTAPSGNRYTKSEDLQGTKTSKREARECRLGNVRVHFFGENLAVLYGSESRVEKDDKGERTRSLIWTDTWLKRDGKWQVIAAQDNWAESK